MLCLSGFELYSRWVLLTVCNKRYEMQTDLCIKYTVKYIHISKLSISNVVNAKHCHILQDKIKFRLIQGFWYFARLWSREIQLNPRNTTKFTKTRKIPRNSVEILSTTCLYNIFETYLSYLGYSLAVNLQLYLVTSSLKRANNVPKLPGVD